MLWHWNAIIDAPAANTAGAMQD